MKHPTPAETPAERYREYWNPLPGLEAFGREGLPGGSPLADESSSWEALGRPVPPSLPTRAGAASTVDDRIHALQASHGPSNVPARG